MRRYIKMKRLKNGLVKILICKGNFYFKILTYMCACTSSTDSCPFGSLREACCGVGKAFCNLWFIGLVLVFLYSISTMLIFVCNHCWDMDGHRTMHRCAQCTPQRTDAEVPERELSKAGGVVWCI